MSPGGGKAARKKRVRGVLEMFRERWINIREKTSGMNKKEVGAYIAAYYWPHILAAISIIALIFLFGGHYLSGNVKPSFTCVMVNQRADRERDNRIADTYAKEAGLRREEVVVDSDYNFSYGDVCLEGVNESSYEKFFFQWRNGELDAVIMSESFYEYCKEAGGEFCRIEDAGSFEAYVDDGICRAVVLGCDSFMEKLTGNENERLLLAFPETGRHKKAADEFLKYLLNVKSREIGGLEYEEIIN